MTEKEEKDIMLDILNGDDVPAEEELRFLTIQLEAFKRERNAILSGARIWKAVRDEERLKACQKDAKKLRDCIEYVETRIGQLTGGVPAA